MFTNEQIREAMQGLVDTKGGDHTSIGRYADQFTGRGACFLGALCEYMGLAIPHEGTRAKDIMGPNAVTRKMQAAFVIAQYLNDNHFAWKYVLDGVDLALKADLPLEEGLGCPCGCTNSNGFTTIIEEVKAIRALDMGRAPKKPTLPAYASGGITTGTITSVTFGSIATAPLVTDTFPTITIPKITIPSWFSQQVTMPSVVTATKGEHTLVA